MARCTTFLSTLSVMMVRIFLKNTSSVTCQRPACCAIAATKGWLLPAAAAFGHSFGGRLPYIIEEANSVHAIFGAVYVGSAATPAQFKEVAADCQLLHLASSRRFPRRRPLFSGLALADGWLTTLDIFQLRLNASLVTLSACQTGAERDRRGG